MSELGYIEGKNIVYDPQVKDFDPEGQKAAVQKFVKDKVDLIFTFPTEATVIAYNNTKGTDIPVVFAMCGVEGNLPIESVNHTFRKHNRGALSMTGKAGINTIFLLAAESHLHWIRGRSSRLYLTVQRWAGLLPLWRIRSSAVFQPALSLLLRPKTTFGLISGHLRSLDLLPLKDFYTRQGT